MKQYWLACMLSICTLASLQAQTPSPVVPDFHFLQKSGHLFDRSQLPAGKPLFFIFFDITCEHCQASLQYLDTQTPVLQKAWVGLVTLDPGPQATAFLNQYAPRLFRLPHAILLRDTRRQFIPLFRPRKYPSLFLYSAQQKLLRYSDEEKDLDRLLQLLKAQ